MITTFFIDLWNDLREKRLWPVAVGVAAAILAIPVLLLKPASDGGSSVPGPAAPAAPSGVRLPTLALDVNATDKGSRLDTFSDHNPFTPMKDLPATAAAASPSPGTSGTPSSQAAKSSGSGGGSSASKAPGGSAGSGSTPASSGSGGGGSSSGSHLVTQQTTTSWIYTATFKFGTPGHMKTIKDAKPFTMLPNETTPTLIFASAGADGKSAIFYIQDPNFQAAGEGKCNAPGSKCKFVTLKTDSSHDEETFISSDGTTEYDVKLESIGRQTISGQNGSSTKPKSPSKGKQVAGARKKQAKASNLDFLPVLLGFSTTKQRRVVHHK